MVEWYCRRQGATSKSSTEAEIVAADDAVMKTGYPLTMMLEELLNRESSWEHGMDSDAARLTLQGRKASPLQYMVRHQRVALGFLRDTFDVRRHPRHSLIRVDTTENESDVFTKGLQDHSFKKHIATLGVVRVPDFLIFAELDDLDFTEKEGALVRGARAAGQAAVAFGRPLGAMIVQAAQRTEVREFILRRIMGRW